MQLNETQHDTRAEQTVQILGVPLNLGADRHGVDMSPSAIRYAGIQGKLDQTGLECADVGNLDVPQLETQTETPTEEHAKYLDEIREVSQKLADEVAAMISADVFPLVLGGDHSVAIGAMRGAARGAPLGVIWFDAHGDYNTPATSPSGNVHGMPLAAVHGQGEFSEVAWATEPNVSEENTVLVGIRELDEHERAALRDSDVTVFTMSDIDERGIDAVVEEALDIATAGVDDIHVSLDLDWLDPADAPGVGTPVNGGVTYREAHKALELVAQRNRVDSILRSMDVVEVNPILDQRNRTAEVAAELAASALGNRII